MYYNARWYDSSLGRFAQADTIIPGAGNSSAWDRYAYTLNNPLRYTDPSGHVPFVTPRTTCDLDCWRAQNQDESDTNLYELGWGNFSQAWSIWTNPNATYGQRFGAGAYMGAWGGAHACLILCTGVAALEYIVPGAISCLIALQCAESIFWSGGTAARTAAEKFAASANRVTLEMTLPGKALDHIGKIVPYRYLKPFWDFTSGQFARGASGIVDVFIYPPKYNPSGVWATIESTALRVPDIVSGINLHIVP